MCRWYLVGTRGERFEALGVKPIVEKIQIPKIDTPRTLPLSLFVQQTTVRAPTGDEDPIPEEDERSIAEAL